MSRWSTLCDTLQWPIFKRESWRAVLIGTMLVVASGSSVATADELTDTQMQAVLELEQQRIKAIDRVIGSVIAIYGNDRSGGGSGVIIHPSGIALTNHHVIMGAGVAGWGGISDGKMYKWKLIGTDPGGDVSVIQMEGREEFPWTPLGDSDTVRVGDWALAMGNPFILSEDQSPTVTLGIVSGVNRYQPGAGQNQLEYGNCIQVDSSINPGNSGGPLFNFQGEVIGINGRGSFQDRGRVNVGLGYAISSNQIRNFIPELLATKLVEHATLDANFSKRDGKVVCSDLIAGAPVAKAGLKLGDELLEFEGVDIKTANQFTNLICTVPEGWPVSLKVRDKEGKEKSICVRAFGLPYSKPRARPGRKSDKEKSPEEKAREKQQNAMVELLSAPPGEVRHPDINNNYANLVIGEWQKQHVTDQAKTGAWKLSSTVFDVASGDSKAIGPEALTVYHDGRFLLEIPGDDPQKFAFDGASFFKLDGEKHSLLTAVEAKTNPRLMAAFGIAAPLLKNSFEPLGKPLIDGSDRTDDKVAWRFRIDDADQDPTFVWFEVNREYGQYETAKLLRKIAPNLDSLQESGVLFSDYKMVHGLAIPQTRVLVNGLNEHPNRKIAIDDVTWQENFDSSIFATLPKKKVENDSKTKGPDSQTESAGEDESSESEQPEDAKKEKE
ncbi:S1C family serine protease [Mariniblastus fucicola]|uniref:S1C family serine protease n=1 Tax=Mariniblastus fucicola TaxID=980251 RepID=UPI001390264D|nr:trypsin-like peptidase domain-containing protein [Mariniblastus fucicola]